MSSPLKPPSHGIVRPFGNGAEFCALYLHIPFCRNICPFCAFAVHGDRLPLHQPYLKALHNEISLSTELLTGHRIHSVYVGGGTPSTLSLVELETLLKHLRNSADIDGDVEITFEVNPEDGDAEYLAGLTALGVTRLSLGTQSFNETVLRGLGRHHSAQQSLKALQAALQYGPGNLNLDLMFGAPGQSMASFQKDVRIATESGATHLSLYALDVEPGTLFARRKQLRESAQVASEQQPEMFTWASNTLREQGYQHYEISNYSLPGRESRQNQLVWGGTGYLGLGMGAHSFHTGKRWWNQRKLQHYLSSLAEGILPRAEEEQLTVIQQANEALMLALRTREGLHIPSWEAAWGFPWGDGRATIVKGLVGANKAVWDKDTLRLNLNGWLLCDEITATLALQED